MMNLTEEEKAEILQFIRNKYPEFAQLEDDHSYWEFEEGIITFWKWNAAAEWTEPHVTISLESLIQV
jgi:hypothetical protein